MVNRQRRLAKSVTPEVKCPGPDATGAAALQQARRRPLSRPRWRCIVPPVHWGVNAMNAPAADDFARRSARLIICTTCGVGPAWAAGSKTRAGDKQRRAAERADDRIRSARPHRAATVRQRQPTPRWRGRGQTEDKRRRERRWRRSRRVALGASVLMNAKTPWGRGMGSVGIRTDTEPRPSGSASRRGGGEDARTRRRENRRR